MNYDKEKIKRFHEYIVEDYNQSLIVEDITDVGHVNKTDGSFTQIGIRPQLDDEMFISQNFSLELPGAGRLVADGERDFLIKSILETEEIILIGLKENELKEFLRPLYAFHDAVILLSTKFYVEVFSTLMHRIDYQKGYPRLDFRHRIFSVPERILKDKIIIIDRNAILWRKKIFENETLGEKTPLDISINPEGIGKVDITLRSVNKIEQINRDLIKVLEVNNYNDKKK